jgi:TonB family protein
MQSDIDALRESLAPRAEFRWSSDVQQPVTLGIWHPLVLLPRRFDDLSAEGKRAVACHELLHVQRRDWLWTIVEAHVRALFWFHPGIWWLVDRLQLLREQVVDELVVERTSSRRDYMMTLMLFADRARPTVLSSAFLRRRHLKSRIQELLKESHMSVPRLALTMVALILVMAGVTAATVKALPLDLDAMAQTGVTSRMEIRLAETTPGVGLQQANVSGSDRPIYLHATPLATWSDVSLARIIDTGNSTFGVAVTFNSETAARMASATAAHLGRPIAIIIDGRVVSAPIVRAPVSDSGMITGITASAAQELIEANLACHTNPAQCVAAVLPEPVYREKPQYTQEAMAAQIEGIVLLDVVVLPDGSTGNISVIRSLDPGLDRQAIDALKRWTWKPGTRGGEPARVAVQVQLSFTLK